MRHTGDAIHSQRAGYRTADCGRETTPTTGIVSSPEPVVRSGGNASPAEGGAEIKNDARGNPLPAKGAA